MTLRRLSLALAATVLAGLGTTASAQAQGFFRPFYYGGAWSGPIVPPADVGPRRLPRAAIFEEVADQGYRPVAIVSRTPDTITLDAIDARQRPVRLTVDAFDGEILSRRPQLAARPEALPRSAPEDIAPPERSAPRRTVQPPKPAPKAAQTPKATAPGAPQGLNPDKAKPAPGAPVAPARDPSQWGKEG